MSLHAKDKHTKALSTKFFRMRKQACSFSYSYQRTTTKQKQKEIEVDYAVHLQILKQSKLPSNYFGTLDNIVDDAPHSVGSVEMSTPQTMYITTVHIQVLIIMN